MSNTGEPFTIGDAVHIDTILRATQGNGRVRWLLDSGDIAEGVARCISHEGGGFLGANEDIRDGFLHVSGMFETWLPIPKLLGMVERGEFAVDR